MSIRQLFNYEQPLVAAATILGIALVALGAIAAYVTYQVKLSGDIVEVTGSAKESVTADSARWIVHLETKTGTGVAEQQQGYRRLDEAAKRVTAYLDTQGFTDREVPPSNNFPVYIYPQGGEPIETGFTVTRDITVRTKDIAKVQEIANNIGPLTGDGYDVTSGGLELTYSGLADMRVKLLSAAIKDAKDRAVAIAKDSGRSVGSLRNAASGVVQVLPQGGVDISDYGSYDTQSMQKDVMVTVRASFAIQ